METSTDGTDVVGGSASGVVAVLQRDHDADADAEDDGGQHHGEYPEQAAGRPGRFVGRGPGRGGVVDPFPPDPVGSAGLGDGGGVAAASPNAPAAPAAATAAAPAGSTGGGLPAEPGPRATPPGAPADGRTARAGVGDAGAVVAAVSKTAAVGCRGAGASATTGPSLATAAALAASVGRRSEPVDDHPSPGSGSLGPAYGAQ